MDMDMDMDMDKADALAALDLALAEAALQVRRLGLASSLGEEAHRHPLAVVDLRWRRRYRRRR